MLTVDLEVTQHAQYVSVLINISLAAHHTSFEQTDLLTLQHQKDTRSVADDTVLEERSLATSRLLEFERRGAPYNTIRPQLDMTNMEALGIKKRTGRFA